MYIHYLFHAKNTGNPTSSCITARSFAPIAPPPKRDVAPSPAFNVPHNTFVFRQQYFIFPLGVGGSSKETLFRS